jgi:hypothetical protein
LRGPTVFLFRPVFRPVLSALGPSWFCSGDVVSGVRSGGAAAGSPKLGEGALLALYGRTAEEPSKSKLAVCRPAFGPEGLTE